MNTNSKKILALTVILDLAIIYFCTTAFLMVQDVPRLYNLFILERYTVPLNYYPTFTKAWQKYARIGVKTGVIGVFLFLFFYLSLVNFLYDPYKQPSTAPAPAYISRPCHSHASSAGHPYRS